AEMVLNRCTAQSQAVASLKQARGLGRDRARVLDRLCLVEDQVVEMQVLEKGGVAPQGAVRGENEVVLVEAPVDLRASGACVVEHAQLRSETRGLLLPVENQRARRDDKRRGGPILPAGLLAQLASRFEQGQHLDSLAQPHVVSQA